MSELNNAIEVLVNTLIDSDAENYNQHIASGDNGVDYVVTVQRKDGLTPCEKLADIESQSEWVSVDDRLPDALINVLVKQAWQGDLMIAFINKDENTWVENCENATVNGDAYLSTDICAVKDEMDYLRVTHWMPLPTPPEGE